MTDPMSCEASYEHREFRDLVDARPQRKRCQLDSQHDGPHEHQDGSSVVCWNS